MFVGVRARACTADESRVLCESTMANPCAIIPTENDVNNRSPIRFAPKICVRIFESDGYTYAEWLCCVCARVARIIPRPVRAQVIGLNKIKSIRIIIWPILICLQLRRPISIESIVTTFVWMHARHIQTNRRDLIRFRLHFQWHAYPDII